MAGKGLFIVLEGPEGAGKSAQIDRLSARLSARGISHVTTREPGGTAVAEAIRAVILDRPDLALDGRVELLLFSASRHAHVEEIIRPALARGDVVLCDRFELSTRAYQGYGRGVPLDAIARVTAEAIGHVTPDLSIVLDVPVSVGRERLGRRDRGPDRIEREDGDFMERVRAGYRELAASEDRIEVIDADAVAQDVEDRLRGVLERRFPAVFGGL